MSEKSAMISLPVDVLFFILGFIITFSTSGILNKMNNIITITFLVISIIQIFNFFYNEEYKNQKFLNLTIGIISLWMAIFTLNHFGFYITLLPSLTTIYCIAYGLDTIRKYYQDKNKKDIISIVILSLITIILLAGPIEEINIKMAGMTFISLALYSFIPKILTINESQSKKTT